MKIHNCIQGSDDWLKLRAGKVTASEADALISPTFKQRDSKGVETYLNRKLAEKWLQGPLPDKMINSMPVEFGQIIEAEARNLYAFHTGQDVQQVGLICDDANRVSCSPDGLIGDDCGLEIKAPNIETHIGYLMNGVLPADYAVQCHFSLYVTGFSKWVFLSYRRGMPPFILTVHRDDAIQATIKTAVESFIKRMDDAWSKLVELNGGKEPERTATPDQLAQAESLDFVP